MTPLVLSGLSLKKTIAQRQKEVSHASHHNAARTTIAKLKATGAAKSNAGDMTMLDADVFRLFEHHAPMHMRRKDRRKHDAEDIFCVGPMGTVTRNGDVAGSSVSVHEADSRADGRAPFKKALFIHSIAPGTNEFTIFRSLTPFQDSIAKVVIQRTRRFESRGFGFIVFKQSTTDEDIASFIAGFPGSSGFRIKEQQSLAAVVPASEPQPYSGHS